MSKNLPEHFYPLALEDNFHFACHSEVPCFTHCCHQLDLVLTPYDVLRLKNRLAMHSGVFLEKYVIIEWDESEPFPLCYLTMIDDGDASCAFISPQGCTVYTDRPGSCRTYPIGRGARQNIDGSIEELCVLVKESHCMGFKQTTGQTPKQYFQNQGLNSYNLYNDKVLKLLKHERIQQGFRPDKNQLDQFILALYNLDMFRQEIADGRIILHNSLNARKLQGLAGDDEEMLNIGIEWLLEEFFSEQSDVQA